MASWILALPALAAACLHWLDGPQTPILAMCLLCLAYLSRRPGALWLWAWVLSQALSGVALASGPVPLLYLALLRPPQKPFLRLLSLLGSLLALHAVVSFLAFRMAGGGHGWRPQITEEWLRLLVWPYYCGHYPRGAHAVGLFLNDNLLGIWCAAVLFLTRNRLLAIPLFLAVGWSYSRSAYLALLGASLNQRRRLWLVALIPLLFLCFATGLDRWRFSADWARTLGGRTEHLRQAVQQLSLLGHGPAGLIDSQWIKTTMELGLLGLLIQAGFCLNVLWGARNRPDLQSALLVFVLGGIGCDLWYSPHLAGTFFLLAGYAQEPESSRPGFAAEPLPTASAGTQAGHTA